MHAARELRLGRPRRARRLLGEPRRGVDAGETPFAALARELREEVGFELEALGPEVWTKTAVFPLPHWDGQTDHVHLVCTGRFTPTPHMTAEQLAAEGVHEVRWWSPEELTGL